MGWCYFHLDEKPKEWFERSINTEYYEVLKTAIVNMRELYAAVKETNTGNVICLVYMLDWDHHNWMNFGYKDMTEFAGPGIDNCPESVFKLLTPLDETDEDNKWAIGWRKRVQEKIDMKKNAKGNGIFKSEVPIRFTNGMEFQYFKKESKSVTAGFYRNNEFVPYYRVKFNLSKHKVEKI